MPQNGKQNYKYQNRSGDSLERLSPAPSGNPELQEIIRGNKLDRGKFAVEKLDEKSKANLIGKLNIHKNPESQGGITELFNFSLEHETIPQLLEAGVDQQKIRTGLNNPAEFAAFIEQFKQKNKAKFEKWDLTSQAAFLKLIEIFDNRGGEFSKKWEPTHFDRIFADAFKKHQEANALRNTNPSLWDKTKEISRETYNWIRENKVKTALIVGGVITVGWIFKKLLGKKDEADAGHKGQEQEGAISKWAKRTFLAGAGIGTLYVLSKIIPQNKVKDWISSMWAKFDSEEDKEKQKEKNELYGKIAAKIGLDDSSLLDVLGEYEFEDFVSFSGQIVGKAAGGAKKLFADSVWGTLADADIKMLPKSVQNFLEKKKKMPQKIEEAEVRLRAFFTRYEKTIKDIYPKKTVRDVIDGLARKGVFGEEFKDKPWILPASQLPLAVQATINNKYSADEQNEIKSLALQAFENEAQQKESTFGPKGLIARLESMAKQDASYSKKIEEVKALYRELEKSRAAFQTSLDKKAPLAELKSRLENAKEAEDRFDETTSVIYAETRGKIPAWGYLSYFAVRYLRLEDRQKVIFTEHIRGVLNTPLTLGAAAAESLNPVDFYKKQFAAAIKRKKDLEILGKNTSTDRTDLALWETNKSQIESFESSLKLAEKRASLKGLRSSELAKYEDEILELEEKTMQARLTAYKSKIRMLKEDFLRPNSLFTSEQKVQIMREIQKEKAALGDFLASFTARAVKRAKLLQKPLDKAGKLFEDYKAITREELSIFNDLSDKWSAWIKPSENYTKSLREIFIGWAKSEKKAGFVKFAKNAKGHVGVMGLLLIPSLWGEYRDIKKKDPERDFLELMKDLGPSALQLLADVCPLTFGASDWYTLWSGQEYFTKKNVKGWERGSRAVWGTLGALLDAATVIPGVDLAGASANGIMRVARGARAGEGLRIIKMWPRIKQIAEALGGWKKFAQHLKNYKASSGTAKAGEALRLAAVPATRLAATIAIGGIAYNAIYSLGEDEKSEGEKLNPELAAFVESQRTNEPEAPKESGSAKKAT